VIRERSRSLPLFFSGLSSGEMYLVRWPAPSPPPLPSNSRDVTQSKLGNENKQPKFRRPFTLSFSFFFFSGACVFLR